MPDVTLNAFSTGYVPTRQQSARVTCLGTARQIAEEDLAVPLSELVLEPRAGPDPVDGTAAGLRQRCQAARRERHGLGRLGGRSARLRVVVPTDSTTSQTASAISAAIASKAVTLRRGSFASSQGASAAGPGAVRRRCCGTLGHRAGL